MQHATIRTAPALHRVTSALHRPVPLLARQLRQAWGEAPRLGPARTLKGWAFAPLHPGLGKAGGPRGMGLRPTVLEDQERAAVMATLSARGYEPPVSCAATPRDQFPQFPAASAEPGRPLPAGSVSARDYLSQATYPRDYAQRFKRRCPHAFPLRISSISHLVAVLCAQVERGGGRQGRHHKDV